MSALIAEDLTVRFAGRGWRARPFTAVDGVSFHIAPGETLGLVGESGSGKTSIGRAILGLAPFTSARLTFGDETLQGDAAHASRRGIQAVFQDPYGSLSPGLNVGQTLAEPLIAQPGLARKDVDRRLRDLIERVGLRPDILRRYPREFSGGQRQRIAIARALALRPSLIVCDEPVSALDLTTQKIVLDLLVDVQRDTGVSYLFITHDLSVVRYISHRVAVLRHGAIVEHGETVAVTEHPSHPYTRQLLLASPLPDVRRQRERRELRRAPTPTTLEPQEVP